MSFVVRLYYQVKKIQMSLFQIVSNQLDFLNFGTDEEAYINYHISFPKFTANQSFI